MYMRLQKGKNVVWEGEKNVEQAPDVSGKVGAVVINWASAAHNALDDVLRPLQHIEQRAFKYAAVQCATIISFLYALIHHYC